MVVKEVLGVWTLVVAISVSKISAYTVTISLMIHSRLYSVALTVGRMKRTVELHEVAELTGLPLFVGCGKVSAYVCARGSCIA